jgi:inosose dehydratase
LQLTAAFVPLQLRASATGAGTEADEAHVRHVAAVLSALGAPVILLADAGDAERYAVAGRPEETRRHGLSPGEWPAFAARVERLARMCREEYGLVACFHPHGGTYVENPEEIERLMEATDPGAVGLCLDTGHVAFGGGDPVATAAAYGERIGCVHLKDIQLDRLAASIRRGEDYAAAAKQGVFVALGEGAVDVAGVLRALEASGYAGWLTVEQDRAVEEATDTLAAAAKSREFLRRLGY